MKTHHNKPTFRYALAWSSASSSLVAEGGPAFTERLVLIEFPDRETALAWYNDADYQSASEFRRLASKGRMILQVGRDNTTNPDPKV